MNPEEYGSNLEPLSAIRIRELENIKKSIIELVETAGKSIMCLGSNRSLPSEGSEPNAIEKLTKAQQEEEFRISAQKFFDLID
ncbi:7729_t:CDS:2, partial [Acaulospora morrowiae]